MANDLFFGDSPDCCGNNSLHVPKEVEREFARLFKGRRTNLRHAVNEAHDSDLLSFNVCRRSCGDRREAANQDIAVRFESRSLLHIVNPVTFRHSVLLPTLSN